MADELPGRRTEPPPTVVADTRVRTGAGTPVTVRLFITNNADGPRVMSVTTLGVDASWLPGPSRSQPLGPGESVPAELHLVPATGTVPARYPLAVAVQAIDPQTGVSYAPTQIAEVDLVVDAPGQVAIGVEPADAVAVFGKKITVSLQNTGTVPVPVQLEIKSSQSTRITTDASDVDVPPGETVQVRGRVRVTHPQLLGTRARHTYTITARTSGSPRHAEGSLTARAILGPGGSKFGILLAILAVWIAAAVLFIPKLANRVRNTALTGPTTVSTATVSPGGGSSSPGAPGGTGGAATPGGSGTAAPGAGAAVGAGLVQLNGTVTGNAPGGVTVSLAPTSLVDEAAAGAVPVGVTVQSAGEVGMIPASALTVLVPTTVAPNRAVITGKDGAWSFPGVKAPGYYLLTFAKPGYQVQRYVLDSSTAVATQPLKVNLTAGQGRLSGTVGSASGAVGAATVTITDGINTITTSSNSKGVIGAWSVTGLSTPSTYLVTAGKAGFSTESALVTLAAGGTAQVSLTLSRGVVSLVGKVSGVNSLGVMGGLGGVQVTATDGTVTRTATTVTSGPVGSYVLADLPPNTYTVTISADGYAGQTRRVTLRKGQSKVTVNAVLTSSAATVAGVVTTSAKDPLNGAGLVLSSSSNTYKITSTADGSFGFTGVEPGVYVLSAEFFGYSTGYATVKAVAGRSSSASIVLVPETTTNKATITGFVGSATSPGNTLCPGAAVGVCKVVFRLFAARSTTPVSISADGGATFSDQPSVDPAASGPTGYTLSGQNGLPPGLYRLTIAVTVTNPNEPGATSYLPATVRVQVPLNGEARAPQVNLFPTNTIGGTISALGNVRTDGPAPPTGGYANCVYAVPLGDSPPDLTKCDPTFDDTSPCLINGTVGNGYADIGLSPAPENVYTITNLCDGTYQVYVVTTNPDYVNPAPVAIETVSHGQSVNYSPHLFRKARVVITFYQDSNGQVVRKTSGLDGTVSCTNGTVTSDVITLNASTATNGQVVVTGVPSGTVSCTVAAGASGLGGTTTNVSTSNDLDTPINLTLTKAVGSFWGRVVSNYGPSGATPVEGAQVTIQGITGYDGTNPTLQTVTVSTDNNGCFAVRPTTSDPLVTATGCGTIAAGSTQQIALLSTSITIGVPTAPAGYRAITPAKETVENGTVPQVTLVPNPVSVTGLGLTINTASGTAPSPTSATITVNSTTAPGSGTVRVTADAAGALSWTDSNYGTGNTGAWPGSYGLTVALDGYTTATATLTCTFADTCTVTSGSLTLTQLGALTGSVIAVLGTTTAEPMQPLTGATVRAQACTPDVTPNPTTCTPIGTATVFTALSGINGAFTLTTSTSNSIYVLPTGYYQVTVSASGFDTYTTFTNIVSGLNSITTGPASGQILVYVTLTSVNIGVVTAKNPSKPPVKADLSSTATVTMTRIDTLQSFPGTLDAATNLYNFTGLVPTTYQVSISGPGIVTTVNYVTLPYVTSPPAPTRTIYFTAGTVQNTVTGAVNGLQGANTAATGLNGVTVELGTIKGGNFSVSDGTDKLPLSTTTSGSGGIDGTFSFTTVPDGTYVIRYTMYGYVQMYGPTQVIVSGGQFASLQAVTMARVSHKLTVTVTTSVGDDPSAWTAELANVGTPTWKLVPDASPSGTPYTWVFNQVPFGCWSFGLTLPTDHHGVLTLTSPPPTDPNITCSDVTVPGTGTADVAAGYTLDERELQITVTATAVSGDPAPATAHVTVTRGATTYYNNASFTVGAGGTTSIWLQDATYTLFAEPSDTTAFPPLQWPSVTSTASGLVTTGPTSKTLALRESGKLVLTVTGAGSPNPESTVTLTPPAGVTLPPAYSPNVTTLNGTFTFYLEPGTWTVTATLPGKTASGSAVMDWATLTSLTLAPA